MFDIGWTEILVIAGIALVIIGPKDLPAVLRTIGQWVGKAKSLAREFQNSIDEVIQDTGADEVKKQIESINSYDMNDKVTEALDPKGELEDAFKIEAPDDKDGEEIDPKEIEEKRVTAVEEDYDGDDDDDDFDRKPPDVQKTADSGADEDADEKQKAGA